MTTRATLVLIAMASLLLQGCVTANRANVSELASGQNAYFKALEDSLTANRATLKSGLDLQVEASHKRRENLAMWELDLQKAEVLLQVDADVTGNQRLLSYKLAEIDIAAADTLAFSRNEQDRADAILRTYDALISAARSLQRNNSQLIRYLESSDEEYFLRTIDIDAIVRSIAGIRDAREQLTDVEARSDEIRQAENERLQRSLERARDAILNALTAGRN